jgi:hypothetical protein
MNGIRLVDEQALQKANIRTAPNSPSAGSRYASLLLLVRLYAFLDCLRDKVLLLVNKTFSVLQG